MAEKFVKKFKIVSKMLRFEYRPEQFETHLTGGREGQTRPKEAV